MFVVSISWWEGMATPLTWLWDRMTLVALKVMSRLHRFPHAEAGGGDPSMAEEGTADHLALGVQTQEVDQLIPGCGEQGREIPARFGGVADYVPALRLGDTVAPRRLGHEFNEGGGDFSHARNVRQHLHRRVEYVAEGAEPVQQRMGGGVGVAPGHSVKQQQLQHGMVVKIIEPVVYEALAEPGSVTLMDAHFFAP
jgi:hypothetical protein